VIILSSFKIFLKTFVITGWCVVLFVGFGYYYLKSQDIKTQNQIEKVPYYSQVPENKGVLLNMGGDNIYFYLDFEKMQTVVILDYEEIFIYNVASATGSGGGGFPTEYDNLWWK
jgi:hypothetical protein